MLFIGFLAITALESWVSRLLSLVPDGTETSATNLVLDTVAEGSRDLDQTLLSWANTIRDDLDDGEDPNSGNSVTSGLVENFRSAVNNTGSPAYSGDAASDSLGDLLKFCIEQKL